MPPTPLSSLFGQAAHEALSEVFFPSSSSSTDPGTSSLVQNNGIGEIKIIKPKIIKLSKNHQSSFYTGHPDTASLLADNTDSQVCCGFRGKYAKRINQATYEVSQAKTIVHNMNTSVEIEKKKIPCDLAIKYVDEANTSMYLLNKSSWLWELLQFFPLRMLGFMTGDVQLHLARMRIEAAAMATDASFGGSKSVGHLWDAAKLLRGLDRVDPTAHPYVESWDYDWITKAVGLSTKNA